MKNLLNSTDIATLFLDKELNIRRFTDQATKIFKLIKSDIGRPLTDQTSQLIYPGLVEDAFEVLRTLIFIEKQIPTKDGKWFSTRIMPYRTFDDRIDGLVITFINITDSKQAEEKLNETEQLNQLLIDQSPDAIIKCSNDWKIQEFNASAEEVFGIKRNDAINKDFIELFVSAAARHKTRQQLDKLLKLADKQKKIKMTAIFAGGREMESEWTADVLFNHLKLPSGVLIITKK
jgi:two-component system CheB/CheR fusion protein